MCSNFGVWVFSEFYTKDLEGLLKCYVLAIPFFAADLAFKASFSTLAAGADFFLVEVPIDSIMISVSD